MPWVGVVITSVVLTLWLLPRWLARLRSPFWITLAAALINAILWTAVVLTGGNMGFKIGIPLHLFIIFDSFAVISMIAASITTAFAWRHFQRAIKTQAEDTANWKKDPCNPSDPQ